jgi:hypothetical protein
LIDNHTKNVSFRYSYIRKELLFVTQWPHTDAHGTVHEYPGLRQASDYDRITQLLNLCSVKGKKASANRELTKHGWSHSLVTIHDFVLI